MKRRLSERARRLVGAINLLWAGRKARGGLETLFTADLETDRLRSSACPLPGRLTCDPDPLTEISSLDPIEVGRQAIQAKAIADVVLWLECSGWYGEDRGQLQQYGLWLIERRRAYEGGKRVPG